MIIVLGATGRIGSLVVSNLLEKKEAVRVLVRNPKKYSEELQKQLSIVQVPDINKLSVEEFKKSLTDDVTAVVSCLGHVLNVKGALFEPMLVRNSAKVVTAAIEESKRPVKFVHLSTVGIDNPDGLDRSKRSLFERGLITTLNVLVPLRDSQGTVNFLATVDKVEWVAVRPGNFMEGEQSPYDLFPHAPMSIFAKENSSRMTNIAHFMCDLVTNNDLWAQWKGKMPVIMDKKNE